PRSCLKSLLHAAGEGESSGRGCGIRWRSLTPALLTSFAEFLAFLGRHIFPAVTHLATHSAGAAMPAAAKATEENAAKREQAKRLPERNCVPAKERRQEPVPQELDHFTAQSDEQSECRRAKNRGQDYLCLPVHHVISPSEIRRKCPADGR